VPLSEAVGTRAYALLKAGALDAPQMPPEYWNNAVIGKYYRPVKMQISLRIDNEVPDWLKSKSDGHLSRIKQILRDCMTRDPPIKKRAARRPP
jgi:uncharacterized protein (DUF4415 family)